MRAIEKRLRQRIRELEAELEKVKADRQGFRDAIISNLKKAILIHGQGQYWRMDSLIEILAKQIQARDGWYW